jgi:hypothetical protein
VRTIIRPLHLHEASWSLTAQGRGCACDRRCGNVAVVQVCRRLVVSVKVDHRCWSMNFDTTTELKVSAQHLVRPREKCTSVACRPVGREGLSSKTGGLAHPPRAAKRACATAQRRREQTSSHRTSPK